MNVRETVCVLTPLGEDGLPLDGDDVAATGIRGVGGDETAAVEGNVRRLVDVVSARAVGALADLLARREALSSSPPA